MMSEKSKKTRSGKERGLNVRVVQEEKTSMDADVKVNSYFERNDPKKKSRKKTTEAKKIAENKATKKPANKRVKKVEKAVGKEIKKTKSAVKKQAETVKKGAEVAQKEAEKKSEKVVKEAKKVAENTEKTPKNAEKSQALKSSAKTEVEKVQDEKKVEEKKAEEPAAEKKEIEEEKKVETSTKVKKEEAKTEAKADDEVKTEAKFEAKPAKAPASFSKSANTKKQGPEILLPEKIEPLQILPTGNVENVAKKDSEQAENTYFETLQLNAEGKQRESRIIPRDVARTDRKPLAESIQKAEKSVEKPARKRFSGDIFKKSTEKQPRKLTAKELKDQEIQKAISTASKLPQSKKRHKSSVFGNFGWARLTLMITCATTAVFAFIYFLNMTSADMSLKVAATQSGIEASYPDYVPRGYELSDVTSASGKVTMNFKSEDSSFTLVEEASSWDSSALLNNYIKENYDDDSYTVVVEQGLTIYMGNNWEAWVNGGILYKLSVKSGSLTKKQLKTIATSL